MMLSPHFGENMGYSNSFKEGLAIKVLKPFIIETEEEFNTCPNAECKRHGCSTVSDHNFCPDCGNEIKDVTIVKQNKTTDIIQLLDDTFKNIDDKLLPNIQYSDATIYFFDEFTFTLSRDDDDHAYNDYSDSVEIKEYLNDPYAKKVVTELNSILGPNYVKLFYGSFNVCW